MTTRKIEQCARCGLPFQRDDEVYDNFGDKVHHPALCARLLKQQNAEMLAALIECADYLAEFFEEGREHRVVQLADATIAKATGAS